jgi:hypothetical protein
MSDEFTLEGYLRQRNPNHVGNPLIEKLPDHWTFAKEKRFYRAIEFYPPYRESVRKEPAELRRELVEDASRFFVPLRRHFTAAELIDTTIREGYRDRNPVDPHYWPTLIGRFDKLRKDLRRFVKANKIVDRRNLGRSSNLCRALFGISGDGKTTFVKELLKLYVQFHSHGSYCGYPLNIQQVVYVYLEVEKNGSVTALCRMFFRELDRLLNTDYLNDYGDLPVPRMLEHMANLAEAHAIGLIVIDELQQLSKMKSGGGPGLLGYFLSLTNIVKVPVLLVGTEESIPFVEARLQDARRTSGIPEWKPFNRKEFGIFWKALSPYQYTRTATDPAELTDVLYAESHGLPDLAVKLYIATQRMLIGSKHNNGSERITGEAIRIAAQTYHPRILEVLNGKSVSGNTSKPPVTGTSSRATAANKSHATAATGSANGNAQESENDKTESVLNRIVADCVEDGAKCYAALKQAGFIKPATEFL